MEVNLDTLIEQWLDSYENGRLPRGKEAQIEAFMVLIKTLKEKGFEQDGLSLVLSKVIRTIIPESYKGQKASEWKKLLEKYFRVAAGRLWPTELATLTEEEKNPSRIKDKPVLPTSDKVEDEPEEEFVRYGKELNRAIFEKTPAPEVQVDSELSEMLGFDEDE